MTQRELLLDNPNAWKCFNCGAGSEDLVYAEDITCYYNIVEVRGIKAYVSAPDNDYSSPTNQRLFCSACDHCFSDEYSYMTGADELEVHYA